MKSLGVCINENLTWHFHLEKLCKKIASAIGAIKQVKPFVSQSTLLCICNSLVQPLFHYCSSVWGNCGKTLPNKLQKLQNRAAQVVISSSYDADADSLFHKVGWNDMQSQRQIQKALMVFYSLNGLIPNLRSFPPSLYLDAGREDVIFFLLPFKERMPDHRLSGSRISHF